MEDWFQRGRRDDTSHERKHAQYGGAPEGGAADSQHFTWWANPASDEPDRATKDDVGGEEDAGLRQVVEGRLAFGQLGEARDQAGSKGNKAKLNNERQREQEPRSSGRAAAAAAAARPPAAARRESLLPAAWCRPRWITSTA